MQIFSKNFYKNLWFLVRHISECIHGSAVLSIWKRLLLEDSGWEEPWPKEPGPKEPWQRNLDLKEPQSKGTLTKGTSVQQRNLNERTLVLRDLGQRNLGPKEPRPKEPRPKEPWLKEPWQSTKYLELFVLRNSQIFSPNIVQIHSPGIIFLDFALGDKG